MNLLDNPFDRSSDCNKLSGRVEIQRYVSGLKYVCVNCGSRYMHQKTLLRHSRYECGVEPMFICPKCGKKFKHNSNLKQHLSKLRCLQQITKS
nr:unnamed protein product [Callosobruchus chinensis]